jgi:hypothetical protein
MSLKNVTLALTASYLAAKVLLKGKRRSMAGSGTATPGAGWAPPVSTGPLAGASADAEAAAPESTAATAVAGVGSESPNAGERVNAAGLGGASAGVAAADSLFDSNSHDGAEPKVPGLPDMFRGA